MLGPRGALLRAALTAAVVLGALVAAILVARGESSRADREAMRLERETVSSVKNRFELTLTAFSGANGIVDAGTGVVPSSSFRRFSRDVRRGARLNRVYYQPRVRLYQRDEYELAGQRIMRRVTPEGGQSVGNKDRGPWYPITYVNPSNRLTRQTLGYDILSEAIRADAARDARDTGLPRLTSTVDILGSDIPALAVFYPVYTPGAPTETVQDRRAAITGLVSGTIAGAKIGSLLTGQLAEGTVVRISAGGRSLTGPAEPLEGAIVDSVEAGGQEFRVELSATGGPSITRPLAVLGLGLGLAVLVAFAFEGAARREGRLARERDAATMAVAEQTLLVRVADAMEAELSTSSRCQALAGTVVPDLAAACAVHSTADGRALVREGFAADTPELAAKLSALPPLRVEGMTREVIRTGRARLLAGAPEIDLRRLGDDRDDLRARLDLGVTSVILTPLVSRGKVVGLMVLGSSAASDRKLDSEDLAASVQVAALAATSLDNARLYGREREIAGALQKALLPSALPELEGFELAATYRAGGDGVEIGGDFYEVFEAGGRHMAIVGDVCGKGAPAAAITSLARHTVRATRDGESPSESLSRLDEAVQRSGGTDEFLTAACVRFAGAMQREAELEFALGGHPAPAIVRADGTVEFVDGDGGSLLGCLPTFKPGEASARLGPGETLVLYTDGLIECRRDGELFGARRFEQALGATVKMPIARVPAFLEERAVAFGGAGDDIVVLALRYSPGTDASADAESRSG